MTWRFVMEFISVAHGEMHRLLFCDCECRRPPKLSICILFMFEPRESQMLCLCAHTDNPPFYPELQNLSFTNGMCSNTLERRSQQYKNILKPCDCKHDHNLSLTFKIYCTFIMYKRQLENTTDSGQELWSLFIYTWLDASLEHLFSGPFAPVMACFFIILYSYSYSLWVLIPHELSLMCKITSHAAHWIACYIGVPAEYKPILVYLSLGHNFLKNNCFFSLFIIMLLFFNIIFFVSAFAGTAISLLNCF